jgi:hypothetical protein
MELALDELYRSQKYHLKQLEENLQSIRSKEEAIQMLKEANEKEKRIIEQINKAIEFIKMDMDLSQSIPTEKQPISSIEEMNGNDNLPR